MALPRSGSRKYSLRLNAGSPLTNTTVWTFLRRGTLEVKSPVSRCGKIAAEAGQTVAGKCFSCQRKVRAPQSRVLGNAQAPRGYEQGHRDEPVQSGVKRGNLHPEQHQIGRRRRCSPSLRVGGLSPGATRGLEE